MGSRKSLRKVIKKTQNAKKWEAKAYVELIRNRKTRDKQSKTRTFRNRMPEYKSGLLKIRLASAGEKEKNPDDDESKRSRSA